MRSSLRSRCAGGACPPSWPRPPCSWRATSPPSSPASHCRSTADTSVGRPFRFAVQTTTATSADEWRDLARKVEDTGYSTLFVADHYLGPGPVSERTLLRPQHLAPIAAMAAAAAWTTTLRIGCRVF